MFLRALNCIVIMQLKFILWFYQFYRDCTRYQAGWRMAQWSCPSRSAASVVGRHQSIGLRELRMFLYLFLFINDLPMRVCVHTVIGIFIHSSIHPVIHSSTHTFIDSFTYSFIYSHTYIHSCNVCIEWWGRYLLGYLLACLLLCFFRLLVCFTYWLCACFHLQLRKCVLAWMQWWRDRLIVWLSAWFCASECIWLYLCACSPFA